MGTYQHIHPRKPESFKNKRAFLIGSGIASLAAAHYLIRDGYMRGVNRSAFSSKTL